MTDEADDSLVKGLFRRGARRVNLSGYHKGDVIETRATRIVNGGAVAGNIRAPEVYVDGLVVGTVVTMDLRISARGRVVGDVCTGHLSVEAGGRIQGWVFALTRDEFDRLQARSPDDGFFLPQVADGTGSDVLPPELRDIVESGETELDRHSLLRQVQALVGDAMLARADLEQHFDRRLEDIAGDTTSRLRNVEQEFAAAQARLNAETTKRTALEVDLNRSLEENVKQRKELDGLRDLLQQRVESLRQAEDELTALQVRTEQLDANNLALQQELSSALEPMDRLKGRVESLENALQASVLRSAEQEQAQLHWQELADASQQRVKELESQLALASEELDRQATVTYELHERFNWVEQERDEASRALAELRTADAVGTLRGEEQQRLDDALARSERLDAQLDAARAEIMTLEEHLAWSQLTIEAAGARLRTNVLEQTASQSDLKRQLEDAAVHIGTQREKEQDLKARVKRLTELLYEADRQAKQRDGELQALRSKGAAPEKSASEQATLRKMLQRATADNDALQKEVARQNTEILEQREQLAQVQATLAEVREDLRQQVTAAHAEVTALRSAAANHIQKLQAKVAEKESQLRDLKSA